MPKIEINGVDLMPYLNRPTGKHVSLDGGRMTFKKPKHLRCKSRKRFVKLLMGCRIPRNYAHFIADKTLSCFTWETKWQLFRFSCLSLQEANDVRKTD